jgi:hypothetical protein
MRSVRWAEERSPAIGVASAAECWAAFVGPTYGLDVAATDETLTKTLIKEA